MTLPIRSGVVRPSPDRLVGSEEAEALLVEMIDRFPVPSAGTRNGMLTLLVASLVARDVPDDVIRSVCNRWFHHFAGAIRSTEATHMAEVESMILRTRSNPDFAGTRAQTRTLSQDDHLDDCRRITLTRHQAEFIAAGRFQEEEKKTGGADAAEDGNRCHTQTSDGRGGRRQVMSGLDTAFVTALVVHAFYARHQGWLRDGRPLRLTNAQIAEVAGDRFPEVDLSARQAMERAKRRFVSRPNDAKPATVAELLVEVRKGRPARPSEGVEATPSVYHPTGLAGLLETLGEPLVLVTGPETAGQPSSVPLGLAVSTA